MAHLSSDEISRYREVGYVVPDFTLPQAELATLRAALDRVLDANPDTRPEQLVSAHIAGRNPEGVVGDDAFLALARSASLVDRVAELIGPDVILWGCQVFCKPGGDGMEVPWHQDGHYWPIRPLATCTVWLAIDDSLVDNGCLRVMPGSHREQRAFEHEHDTRDGLTLNRRVASRHVDDDRAHDIELRAGQMSMHDVYMIHGSNPNRSSRRRAGVAVRYMPGTSHFQRDLIEPGDQSGYTVDFATRPLWLLKGRDRTGKNDFTRGHATATA